MWWIKIITIITLMIIIMIIIFPCMMPDSSPRLSTFESIHIDNIYLQRVPHVNNLYKQNIFILNEWLHLRRIRCTWKRIMFVNDLFWEFVATAHATNRTQEKQDWGYLVLRYLAALVWSGLVWPSRRRHSSVARVWVAVVRWGCVVASLSRLSPSREFLWSSRQSCHFCPSLAPQWHTMLFCKIALLWDIDVCCCQYSDNTDTHSLVWWGRKKEWMFTKWVGELGRPRHDHLPACLPSSPLSCPGEVIRQRIWRDQ